MVAVACTGLITLTLRPDHGLMLAACIFCGLGLGGLCTTTLVMMLQRSTQSGYAIAAMTWNITYDAGTGLGSLVLAGIAGGVGVNAVFFISAVLLLAFGSVGALGYRTARMVW